MAKLFDLLSDDVGGTDIINTLNTATKSPPRISTDTEKKSMLDRFDRPIPGQSMTSELGNAKYEQPPQYTELSEFMDFLFKRMNSPKIYRVRDGRPEERGLDTRSLKEAFKSNSKEAESPEIPDLENSLVTRREPNE